ncbi:MAG: hypothetical protein H6565_16705 [Lewinellaceae bacterium]|nr:hypothetical protein [Lewinellaceae bacterium]
MNGLDRGGMNAALPVSDKICSLSGSRSLKNKKRLAQHMHKSLKIKVGPAGIEPATV